MALLVHPAAEAADWRKAGGPLFARPASAADPVVDHTPRNHSDQVASPVQPYAAPIAAAALAHGLDPKLLHAIVIVESAYDARAVSPVGAAGLTQLMAATARDTGVRDRFDPLQSLDGGAAYLATQINRFGDLRLALAAYNAGPGRVARLGRVPDLTETKAYVVSVVDCYLALTAGRTVRSSAACSASSARL